MTGKTAVVVSMVLLLAVGTGGCGMTRATQRPPAPVAVVQPVPPEKLAPRKGSIWQTSDRNTLFLDNKARNVGDIITVLVSERSEAAKKANTKLDRNNDNSFALSGLFDMSKLLNATAPAGDQDRVALSQGGAASNHKFEGKADTDRESELLATVSCLVTEVLPNGNLRIEGRQDITVNHETQFIVLSGIIRPEDISPQNSVMSAKMADARIEYGGEGDVDSQQRPSWLNRFFSSVNIL